MRLLGLLTVGLLATTLLTSCGPIAADGGENKTNVKDDKKAVKDEEAILGTWAVVKVESEGKDVTPPEDALKEFRFVFKPKGEMTLSGPGQTLGGSFTIDPSAKVKAIDIGRDGTKTRGVYELDGDTLKLSMPEVDKPRPIDLRALDKGTGLMTLKRVKDGK